MRLGAQGGILYRVSKKGAVAGVLIAVGLGTVSWLRERIGFYFVLRGLGLPPSATMLSVAVFVLAFSTVVGAVSSLPGGSRRLLLLDLPATDTLAAD